jgi:hypothetical protein
MNATAQQRAAAVEPAIDPVYTTRDDLAQAFKPANAYERMLLTNAAQAQQRLLRAYELERRLLEKHDILDLFTEKPEIFKTMARHIAECDRIFRRAIEALERAQRDRAKTERTQTSNRQPATSRRPPLPEAPSNESATDNCQPATTGPPLHDRRRNELTTNHRPLNC